MDCCMFTRLIMCHKSKFIDAGNIEMILYFDNCCRLSFRIHTISIIFFVVYLAVWKMSSRDRKLENIFDWFKTLTSGIPEALNFKKSLSGKYLFAAIDSNGSRLWALVESATYMQCFGISPPERKKKQQLFVGIELNATVQIRVYWYIEYVGNCDFSSPIGSNVNLFKPNRVTTSIFPSSKYEFDWFH